MRSNGSTIPPGPGKFILMIVRAISLTTSCFVYSAGNLGDFERVYKRKTEARDALKAEYAESQGRVKTHQEAMESCRRELGEAQYAGVDGR